MSSIRRRVIQVVARMGAIAVPMGVGVWALNPHPNPLPEYRAREAEGRNPVEAGLGPAGRREAGEVRAVSESEVRVSIDNFTFSPGTITVPVGTKVTWVNRDDVPHTVTSSTKPRTLASEALDTDQQYSHVFTAAGSYSYFCSIHPHMTGTVVVK